MGMWIVLFENVIEPLDWLNRLKVKFVDLHWLDHLHWFLNDGLWEVRVVDHLFVGIFAELFLLKGHFRCELVDFGDDLISGHVSEISLAGADCGDFLVQIDVLNLLNLFKDLNYYG